MRQTQLDLSTKPRAQAALSLASAHHFGIERKYCGSPYIEHPIRVAESLVRHGLYSEDIICTALLHDCLEDRNRAGFLMAPSKIEDACGPKVSRWVMALTKTKKANRQATNDAYTKRLLTAPAEVQAIKLADILDNVTGLVAADPKFAPIYLDEKETQAKALREAGQVPTSLGRLVLDQIADERNQLAIHTLHMMQNIEATRIQDEREIANLIAEEENRIFADYAIF
jgi:(p)ppGpp synthase/HD superfamily hydrolase